MFEFRNLDAENVQQTHPLNSLGSTEEERQRRHFIRFIVLVLSSSLFGLLVD